MQNRLQVLLLPQLLTTIACSAALSAQARFEQTLVEDHFAPLRAGAFAVLDVDGDGDQDVVADDRLLLNDGTGVLTDVSATHMPPTRGPAQQIHVGDLDGDGDADLLVVQGLPRLLRNDFPAAGFTELTATHLPALPTVQASVGLGDVDGDGDLDIALGMIRLCRSFCRSDSPVQNRLLLNDGSGRFSDATSAGLPAVVDATRATVLADIDGDLDLDLVFGNDFLPRLSPIPSRVCLNDGTGQFADSTSPHLPGNSGKAYAAVDVDGDGDIDLLGATSFDQPPAGLFRNDGHGRFTADPRLPEGLPGGVVLIDVDGDGDEDVLYAQGVVDRRLAYRGRLFLNDGAGAFTEQPAGRGLERASGTVAAIDHDGDGDLDLLCGAGTRFVNAGDGSFAATHAPWVTNSRLQNNALATGDFDANGEPDLMIGSQVLLQHNGQFHHSQFLGSSMAAANVDLDGDGDLDLVTTDYVLNPTRLHLNDGTGSFTGAPLAWLPSTEHHAYAVIAADVDHDGDADLVFAGVSRASLWQNDGTGRFVDATNATLPATPGPTTDVAAGDVNGDGILDLVVAHGDYVGFQGPGDQNRLLLGRPGATGGFVEATAGRLPDDLTPSFAVALADLDADGDLDIVFGNEGQDRLLLNDGLGTFTDVTSTNLPPGDPLRVTRHIAVGDATGNGHLDLLLGQFGTGARLLEGDGLGAFADATNSVLLPTPATHPTKVALTDLDLDGDADIVLVQDSDWPWSGCGYPCPPRITGRYLLTNLGRQLTAPRLALLGQDWELRIQTRGAPQGAIEVAIPFIAAARAHIPLPGLGILGLDPASLEALPPLVIPQPAGEATRMLRVPGDPSLAGVDVYAQALIVRSGAAPQLTGVVHDRILR